MTAPGRGLSSERRPADPTGAMAWYDAVRPVAVARPSAEADTQASAPKETADLLPVARLITCARERLMRPFGAPGCVSNLMAHSLAHCNVSVPLKRILTSPQSRASIRRSDHRDKLIYFFPQIKDVQICAIGANRMGHFNLIDVCLTEFDHLF